MDKKTGSTERKNMYVLIMGWTVPLIARPPSHMGTLWFSPDVWCSSICDRWSYFFFFFSLFCTAASDKAMSLKSRFLVLKTRRTFLEFLATERLFLLVPAEKGAWQGLTVTMRFRGGGSPVEWCHIIASWLLTADTHEHFVHDWNLNSVWPKDEALSSWQKNRECFPGRKMFVSWWVLIFFTFFYPFWPL